MPGGTPMSVFNSNILTRLTTELFGFGCVLNPDGSVASITGATQEYVTAAPAATRNGGSIAQRSDGSLWITAGGGVWVLIGGAASGWNLPNDVVGSWGTTSPLQVQSVYVSASNRFDIRGIAVSQATAQASVSMRYATGADTITGAVVGAASGGIEILTGATDSTNAGGTAGPSGPISIGTGASTSTAGLSGSTGALNLSTGDSEDANSGNISLTTGFAVFGTRGSLDINAPTVDVQSQLTQLLLIDNSTGALQIGATGALNMLAFTTTNGAEFVQLNAVSGMQAVDNVAFKVGTTAADQFLYSFSSSTLAGSILGTDVTGGGAVAGTRNFKLATGKRTLNDAALGTPPSGTVTILSGTTDCTNAGGTAGPSGPVNIGTGAATSTAGTSGATGAVNISTGNSDDASSGNVSITTGTNGGGGVRGVLDLNVPSIDTTTQATDFNIFAGSATALRIVQGVSVFLAFDTSSNQINATQRATVTDGVTAGTARVVGGRAFSTTVDSATITGNGAAQSFSITYPVPANTLKAGSTMRIHGSVRRTGINAADTATVAVRFGGTTYLTSAAVAAGVGDRCVFELWLNAAAAPGAAVAVLGTGMLGWSTAANFAALGGSQANLATNGALTVDVQVTMANNPGNTAVLEQLDVDVL